MNPKFKEWLEHQEYGWGGEHNRNGRWMMYSVKRKLRPHILVMKWEWGEIIKMQLIN